MSSKQADCARTAQNFAEKREKDIRFHRYKDPRYRGLTSIAKVEWREG
jgi:hypothetical protein